MPDLEAVFIDPETKLRHGWRYALPLNRPVRLGRDPEQADWVMEHDGRISGLHAVLTWNGEFLEVKEREGKRPKNRMLFRGVEQTRFQARTGDMFQVGLTQFIVRTGGEMAGLDLGLPKYEHTLTIDEVARDQGGTAPTALTTRVFEEAARAVRIARPEAVMMRQLLRVLLDALPWAEAAGVVFVPPGEMLPPRRVGVREQVTRVGEAGGDRSREAAALPPKRSVEMPIPGSAAAQAAVQAATGGVGFAPSRRLVGKALGERKSCLHVWLGASDDFSVSGGMAAQVAARSGTLWAICTPLPGLPQHALYVTGTIPPPAPSDPVAVLGEYQRMTQAVAHFVDARCIGFRTTAQVAALRDFCPRPLHPTIEDPVRFQELMQPKEVTATVLFCDLRGFTSLTEDGDELLETWERLRLPVQQMSQTITDHGGIVAGFQGDAVMGFWGWPEEQPDQVRAAARAAVRIHEALTRGLRVFRCGIGLAHGPVVAGRLGAFDLAKVDVFGPTVNLASRLEGMTKVFGVPILANGAVADRLAADPRWAAELPSRRLARVIPKGMTTPVTVHELFPRAYASMDEGHRQEWENAIGWFIAGEWGMAYERLEQDFGGDPPAQYVMKVMDSHDRTPPVSWADPQTGGAIRFEEKFTD